MKTQESIQIAVNIGQMEEECAKLEFDIREYERRY